MVFKIKSFLFSLRIALCIVLLSTLGSQLYSQGNLQFNQVLTYNLSGPASVSSTLNIVQTISINVPANKVWKIESASERVQGTGSFYFGAGASYAAIVIDNNIVDLSEATSNQSHLPLWLPEGTHTLQLVVDNFGTSCNTCIAYGMISGIEFNIIP